MAEYIRSFRRHLMNSQRDAKRRAMRELEEIIIGLPDKPGNHRRNIALDHLAKTKMLVMSDTVGAPAALPEQVETWVARGPAQVLKTARAFLLREADIIVNRTGGPSSFQRHALRQIAHRLCQDGPIDVHFELQSAAKHVRMDMMADLNTGKISSGYLIETLLREVCGLDGVPDARGKISGDQTAAIKMAKSIAEGLRLEHEASYGPGTCREPEAADPTF